MPQVAWFLQALVLLSINIFCKWHQHLYKITLSTSIGFLALALISENAYAIDIQTILTNVSNVLVPLTGMVLVISYVCGIYMIFHGIAEIRRTTNFMMAQSQSESISGPILHIVVGAILIWLPTSTDIFMNSIFGSINSIFGSGSGLSSIRYQSLGTGSSLLGYLPGDSIGQQWASIANTLVMYIQFLGLLSFIKGWFLISKSAGTGAQPGNFAKGLTHIIGGIIAINFIGVVNIISNTVFGT
jgi:intracellular multiplication protein IcmC